ncbi:MAG: efflux RND transporter periplasmic adaptor subunit [Alphaproteobacteria bacterium]|nr:efflux RND transporter periplasmic adaptor subunit [Alphaproteobacteria bacterium]
MPLLRRILSVIVWVTIVGALGWAVWWYFGSSSSATSYKLAAVTRVDILETVSATGKLEARNEVEVGSQISGKIIEVRVDFGDMVKKGDVLAIIDPESYQAKVKQAEADLAVARADMKLAESTWRRTKKLAESNAVSASSLDDAEASLEKARANVSQAEASLSSAKTDLERTAILAPIDGVVIDRAIEMGQTVAASLSAPTLFTLAEDLKKIRVRILVDEADIGHVQVGQASTFTVDAYTNLKFDAVIAQIRKQPEETSNVVTYIVMADADNPDEKLLPGMTANVTVEVANHKGVLAVPRSATRWAPEGAQASRGKRAVWVLKDGTPEAVEVKLGASSGQIVEVTGDLKEGEQVITGVNGASASSSNSSSSSNRTRMPAPPMPGM